VILAACQSPSADQSAAAVKAVWAADSAWEKAFTGRDTTAAVAGVEATGSVLAPNAPIATGPDAIRALFAGFYAIPELTLDWNPVRVEASSSGDLAFSTGTYEMTFKGPTGTVTEHGKYATVWRKQSDGSWKVVLDVFNSDLPMPGA
jgi:ketosteroid isomerase-like protein